MAITLSQRVQRIEPSPTIALSAKANELKAQGRDIINLTVGEPDFDTPKSIKQAAVQAIHDGKTKYTAVDGTSELKQTIIQKLKRENKLQYEPKQILVSCGVKHSLYNLCQVLLNEEDEVLIPTPYWVSYPAMVSLAGAKPIPIKTNFKQHFKITAKQLEESITPKTRLLFLNSPSNPSGVAYSRNELAEIGKVLLNHPHVYIASDDIYEHILWNQKPFSQIVNACPDLYERTIVFNGVSKAYAMTGWRIGYAAGHADIIGAMKKTQSQSTSCPASISQAAATKAVSLNANALENMVNTYKERHDFMYAELSKLAGFRCLPADGTFYIFPNIEQWLSEHPQCQTDVDFAQFLLETAEIAVVPGSAFGQPGCFRLSYATSVEQLEKAIERLIKI